MITAAAARGYTISDHRGVALTPELLAWAHTILAMDQAVLKQLHLRTAAADRPKIRLYLTDADVPDPWGKEPADFADCAALIEHGADQHIT